MSLWCRSTSRLLLVCATRSACWSTADPVTTLLVTHDVDEAARLGDRNPGAFGASGTHPGGGAPAQAAPRSQRRRYCVHQGGHRQAGRSRSGHRHVTESNMLLIFDCDGVLVDSEQLANAALAELMTSLGYPMIAEEAIRIFTGRSLADVVTLAESLLGRPIPTDIGERYGERLLARFRSELEPVAGVHAAIAALPYRKCVASSSTRERLMLSLELTGLAPLFGQHVYSATQVARGKPAPDLFLFAAAVRRRKAIGLHRHRRFGSRDRSCVWPPAWP